jgi:hypothetical protein
MIGQKSTLVRKKISDRHIHFELAKVIELKRVISLPKYITNGEEFLVVKDVESCELILDGTTTSEIKIKSLTDTIIKSKQGRIDEYYDEILINNRACIELIFLNGNWYITSSDGIKLD